MSRFSASSDLAASYNAAPSENCQLLGTLHATCLEKRLGLLETNLAGADDEAIRSGADP